MTKEELSEQFTNEVIEKIKPLINETFLKGYELGALQTASTVKVDDVTYYDLGLPSGTLWSEPIYNFSLSYKMCCHREAQNLNIPTKEQFIELLNYCNLLPRYDSSGKHVCVNIIGSNGTRIYYHCFNSDKYYVGEGININGENKFWIKGSPDEKNNADSITLNLHGNFYYCKHFTGYRLPVFLVKSKSEL